MQAGMGTKPARKIPATNDPNNKAKKTKVLNLSCSCIYFSCNFPKITLS